MRTIIMRGWPLIVSALAIAATPALAADDIMAGFYGNTVISAGGMLESHTHYRADHTFDVTATAMGRSFNAKGTWRSEERRVGKECRSRVGRGQEREKEM